MGKEADDVLKSFGLSDEEQKVYTTVTGKYVNYFNVRRNTIFERARFNLRKQEEGESVDQFITSLYTLAEHCDYGELKDQLIWDRIVVGLRDAKISEKLQMDPALTLEKAVTQARQKEAVHEQQSIVRSYVSSENKIDSVKFRQRHSQTHGDDTQGISQRHKMETSLDVPVAEPYRHIVGVSAQLGMQSAEVAV